MGAAVRLVLVHLLQPSSLPLCVVGVTAGGVIPVSVLALRMGFLFQAHISALNLGLGPDLRLWLSYKLVLFAGHELRRRVVEPLTAMDSGNKAAIRQEVHQIKGISPIKHTPSSADFQPSMENRSNTHHHPWVSFNLTEVVSGAAAGECPTYRWLSDAGHRNGHLRPYLYDTV
ncbi:hypothetical protein RHGRI_004968 [Rhododendron griersonianum]|uniref:Uncharacterized protein n=1 Tax=Rhododendron griersonianum TaxID=479676 RepID=A0AAV6LBK7_9ERIC|nr:hypothetical protein RHGRI_004968 [Rhododendron griersonianum]